jgi:hypothetical protein
LKNYILRLNMPVSVSRIIMRTCVRMRRRKCQERLPQQVEDSLKLMLL